MSVTPRRRYRGRLFVALHGTEDAIKGIAVCTDWLTACMALERVGKGDIQVHGPNEGGELRSFFNGGPAPLPIPMYRHAEPVAKMVARYARCTERHARRLVEQHAVRAAGVGGEIFRELAAIRSDPEARNKFAVLAGWRP